MNPEPLNRFDRIVAILIQLQSRRLVKAQDLADRFQVSLRTIYRDIRSLEASGVPVLSEAGMGYSIMEGYRLPPVMFTREEAGSFVAAEKLMQHFADKALGAYHESAMYKVKSVLRGSEKDWISNLEAQVFVHPAQELFKEHLPNALALLFESIAEKRQVDMQYQSFYSEELTERSIEPIGLFHEHNYWYVMGYCHLRRDYRQFRSDRILSIKRTGKLFTLVHGTLDEYRKKEASIPHTTIRLAVDKKMIGYIKNSRKYYGFVAEKVTGDEIEMTFRIAGMEEAFARWYLMFGDHARILEPESLKEQVKRLLAGVQLRL